MSLAAALERLEEGAEGARREVSRPREDPCGSDEAERRAEGALAG